MNHQDSTKWVGFVSNKHSPSREGGICACISHRITMVIHVKRDHQINYNCFNEPFAVSPYKSLYLDMHGLIFETSIWLLAGSTRLLSLSSPLLTILLFSVISYMKENTKRRRTTLGRESISSINVVLVIVEQFLLLPTKTTMFYRRTASSPVQFNKHNHR